MTEPILDRLDRDPGGARRYVANLFVVGGATREQVAEALARKYGIRKPTTRVVTTWRNNDPKLKAMIAELEEIRRDLQPGDDPTLLLPPEIDPADTSSDLFGLAVKFPAFGKLLHREGQREDDDASPDDVRAVLLAGHDTAAEFEADCERRVGDYDPHTPKPGAGSLA